MMLILQLAMRNTRRNLRRTLLTAATVVIGTGIVVVAIAWISGVFGQVIGAMVAYGGHIRVVDADFLAKEELQPLYENIEDADAAAEVILGIDGVTQVVPYIRTGVLISTGEELGDDFGVVVGASEDYYAERLRGPEVLVDGTWLTGAAEEVVLGRYLARDLKVSVGDEILMLGQTQYGSMSPIKATVVGVVAADALVDSQAYIPLEEARWLVDLPGGAIELLVYTDSDDPAVQRRVAEQIRSSGGLEGLATQAWSEREPMNLMLPILGGMKFFLIIVFVFMTALAIFNTMTMSVLERTAEIGVLRSFGLTRGGAVSLFVIEALFIGLVGGIGGALFGGLGALYLEKNGISLGEDMVENIGQSFPMSTTFYADLTPDLLALALVVGLVMAAVGAFLPSLRAAFIQPVVAMRARR